MKNQLMNRSTTLATLALTLLVTSGEAQQPTEPLRTRTGVALPKSSVSPQATSDSLQRELAGDETVGLFSNLRFIQESEQGLQAYARSYGVEFTPEGFAFTPAFGRRAPHNMPFEFQLESIGRGAHLIEPGVSEPTADGYVVSYQRPLGIVESYDIRTEGMEQTFTFQQMPAGSGDLVVRGRVSGPLQPDRLGESSEGLRFEAAGLGAVRFGGVTGIDAEGVEAAGTVRFDGQYLELVLPEAFVQSASYPMVLDPLVGAEITVVADGDDTVNADTAYDATNDRYCTITQWERSATDVVLWIVIHDASGTVFFVSGANGSGPVNLNPSVAHCNLTDTFFMVWQAGPSLLGPWDLTGLVLGPNGENPGFTIDLMLTPGVSESQPDVGSESTTVDDELMLVWNQDGEIWGAMLDVPGPTVQPTFGTPFRVDTSSFGTDSKPAISKAGGTSGNHLVTWQRLFDDANGNDRDLYARAYDRDGNALTGQHAFSPIVRDDEDPDVDGDGENWSIVFEASALIDNGDNDIYCQPVSYDSGGGVLVFGDEVLVEGDVGQDESDPAVAYLGPKTVVAWSEAVGFLDYDVVLRGLDSECDDCGPDTVVAGTSRSEGNIAIASHLSGDANSTSDAALVVYDRVTPLTADGDVHAFVYEAIGAGGPVSPNLFSECGGGGFMSLSGPVAIGSEVTFDLAGAAAEAITGRLAFNPADLFAPFGGCTWLVWHPSPGLRITTTPVAGSDSVTLTLPCDPGLVGGQINAQWMVIGTFASPWLIPNISLSNIIDFTLGL